MIKKVLSFALVLCLMGVYANATETLLDGCEDTVYTTAAGTGESVSLANSTDSSEGTNSLEITYNYVANTQWTKSTSIAKEFATPIDLSDMEFMKVDFNVDAAHANSSWFIMIYITDAKGYVFRASYATAFDTDTGGWKTFTAKLSSMDNSEWVVNGRPANMAKIAKLDLRIMNDADLTSDGTLVALMDNVRFVSETGSVQEVVLDDFESYADDTAVNSEWAEAFGRTCPAALDTTDPYADAKAYAISPTLSGVDTNFGREYTFASAQDFSTVKYIKLGVRGDVDLAGYTATAHMWLVDNTGNVALASIYGWAEAGEWSNMFLTFQGTGIADQTATNTIWKNFKWDGGDGVDVDITNIEKIRLSVQAGNGSSSYPIAVDVAFDEIVLGYVTQDEPIPSDQQYNVGKCAVAPTIDGVISAGEWADAGSQICTGFVAHDNPATPATEDPEVKIMYDDTNLYLCWEVSDSVFNQDFSPNSPGDDVNSAGDKFPMYFTPNGPMADGFYRISLVPNPGDSTMYMWDEAATSGFWPGVASWNADNDSGAFSYSGGVLIIEYQIPWTDFDLVGLVQTGAPADGTKWGAQLCFSNPDLSESVNWEPDDTPTYVQGRPFGEITFTGTSLMTVIDWAQY